MRFAPAAAVLLLTPLHAHAHAILIESTPVVQGHISAGRSEIVLRYNSRIDAGRSKLALTWPDKHEARLPAAQGSWPDRLSAVIDLVPGDYVLRWQVLAIDGHLTRGRVPFTVDPAASAATSPGR